jgi:hypothetical protein
LGPPPQKIAKRKQLESIVSKVFEDCQETFSKKFLDRGLGQRPNSNHNRLHRLAVQPEQLFFTFLIKPSNRARLFTTI